MTRQRETAGHTARHARRAGSGGGRLSGILAAALGVLLMGGALALAPVSAAHAHDFLVDSDPAAGSTVTQPVTRVTLTFSDIVLDPNQDGSSSIVQVTDASGRHFETACAATQGRTVIAPVVLGDSGTYTVSFQIVSSDGHTVSDRYTFDYSQPEGSQQADGTDRSVCASGQQASPASPQADGQDDALAKREADASGLGTELAVVGGIFAVVVIGVIAALLLVRKKPRA